MPVPVICRNAVIGQATYFNSNTKYGDVEHARGRRGSIDLPPRQT